MQRPFRFFVAVHLPRAKVGLSNLWNPYLKTVEKRIIFFAIVRIYELTDIRAGNARSSVSAKQLCKLITKDKKLVAFC